MNFNIKNDAAYKKLAASRDDVSLYGPVIPEGWVIPINDRECGVLADNYENPFSNTISGFKSVKDKSLFEEAIMGTQLEDMYPYYVKGEKSIIKNRFWSKVNDRVIEADDDTLCNDNEVQQKVYDGVEFIYVSFFGNKFSRPLWSKTMIDDIIINKENCKDYKKYTKLDTYFTEFAIKNDFNGLASIYGTMTDGQITIHEIKPVVDKSFMVFIEDYSNMLDIIVAYYGEG